MQEREMTIMISGLGIIFYSPYAVAHIAEGDDYLTTHYIMEEQVQEHIQVGGLNGFCTGSPGTYVLRFHVGYPEEEFLRNSDFKLRLGLDCRGNTVCFRDLYDLLNWSNRCPPGQSIELDDGYYHVTLCSDYPATRRIGDNQIIDIYFQELQAFPPLASEGIPMLGPMD